MKAIYVVFSDGIESMAYLDQERGVAEQFCSADVASFWKRFTYSRVH